MKLIQKNRTILLAILIFLVAILTYNYFLKPSISTGGDNAQNIGNDVVDLYTNIQTVKFDRTLFSSPLYLSLIDWTPSLPDMPTGRSNPFAPIGQ